MNETESMAGMNADIEEFFEAGGAFGSGGENDGFAEETAADGASEWDLDDTPDDVAARAPEQETFRLKHLGSEREVTREEVIALAQKGQDYDRIRERLVRLESGGINSMPGRAAMARNIHDFISEYGSKIDPATIPAEVWRDVQAGRPLVVAFQSYENRQLRGELQGNRNRARTPGGTRSAGDRGIEALIESDWYKN